MAGGTNHEDAFPIESVSPCMALARTRLPARARAVVAPDSFEREAAFRTLAFRRDQVCRLRCPANKAYRCKTRHDAYCRSHRRGGFGTPGPRAMVGIGPNASGPECRMPIQVRTRHQGEFRRRAAPDLSGR